MKTKKIILLGLILLLITGCGKAKLPDGKELVLQNDNLKLTAESFYERLKEESGMQVLIQMIDESILNKKYPTTKEMEKELNSIIAGYKEQFGDEYLDYLNYYSGTNFTTEQQLFDYLETNNKRDKLVTDYALDIITTDEIEKYYDEVEVGKMRASHILITPEVTGEMTAEEITKAEKEARDLALNIIKKLNDGEDFKELAIEYSADGGSASNGGDVGYFEHGQMVIEFEEATMKLKINEYSKTPVKSQYGYHIILKTEQLEKEELDKVRVKIVNILINEKKETISNIYGLALEKIIEEYNLKIYDSKIKELYNNYITNLKNY